MYSNNNFDEMQYTYQIYSVDVDNSAVLSYNNTSGLNYRSVSYSEPMATVVMPYSQLLQLNNDVLYFDKLLKEKIEDEDIRSKNEDLEELYQRYITLKNLYKE